MADNNQGEKPSQEKKEKGPSVLETIVNDSRFFLNGLIATGALAAGLFYGAGNATTWQDALLKGAPAASIVASQPLATIATSEQPASKDLRNASLYGLIQLPLFDFTYKTALLNASNIGGVVNVLSQSIPTSAFAAAGITFAAAPLFLTPALYPIAYFLKNDYSFKGFSKELKENYLKTSTITAGTFGVTTGLAAGAAVMFPAYATYILFPAAALGNYLFGIVNSYYRKNPEDREGLLKYFVKSLYNTTRLVTYPIGGALSIGGKVVSGTFEAIYNLGSAIRGLIPVGKSVAPTPAPTPPPRIPAPAPVPA